MIELVLLVVALVLTIIALAESRLRNYVAWAVLILVLLALYPNIK